MEADPHQRAARGLWWWYVVIFPAMMIVLAAGMALALHDVLALPIVAVMGLSAWAMAVRAGAKLGRWPGWRHPPPHRRVP